VGLLGSREKLIDEQAGVANPLIFSSEEIAEREVEKIFTKTWVFVGHESEIPAVGDYVTRRIGSDSVIMVRADEQEVKVLLNVCRHRGAKICKADSGRARTFVCDYHRWTYDRSGNLVTTSWDFLYDDSFDKSQWGLVPMPRVATKYGMVFASWNPDVSDLDDYLGDMLWYLDIIFGRTPEGVEVLGPPERWLVDVNWKIPALNFGVDGMHVPSTHRARSDSVAIPFHLRDLERGAGPQAALANGHNASFGFMPHELGIPDPGTSPDVVDSYAAMLSPEQLDVQKRLFISTGNIFPNLSYIESVFSPPLQGTTARFRSLRQWQPRGANQIEILSWYLADRAQSAEEKQETLRRGVQGFSMVGLFEQDDMEMWQGINRGLTGSVARKYPLNFQTVRSAIPKTDFPGPGKVYDMYPETTQWNFLKEWDRMMGA